MTFLRRAFYLCLGFTFPGFWMLHASGYWGALYRPIQLVCDTSATGWPSLLTAALLYLTAIVCFELCWRLLKDAQP